MDAVEPGLLPDDALVGTIRYYRSHWDALTRWLDHPELPPDNSRSELGSGRWPTGTEGAHRAAALLGVVATARNLRANMRDDAAVTELGALPPSWMGHDGPAARAEGRCTMPGCSSRWPRPAWTTG